MVQQININIVCIKLNRKFDLINQVLKSLELTI
jgi:hypothetical protein